jgi:plasmid maintenance system antidote protein VapI
MRAARITAVRPFLPLITSPALVNEKRGISLEMAVRLSKVLGDSAETWLTQQAHYDLAQVAPTVSSSSGWN